MCAFYTDLSPAHADDGIEPFCVLQQSVYFAPTCRHPMDFVMSRQICQSSFQKVKSRQCYHACVAIAASHQTSGHPLVSKGVFLHADEDNGAVLIENFKKGTPSS
jgi:hypothetical protein